MSGCTSDRNHVENSTSTTDCQKEGRLEEKENFSQLTEGHRTVRWVPRPEQKIRQRSSSPGHQCRRMHQNVRCAPNMSGVNYSGRPMNSSPSEILRQRAPDCSVCTGQSDQSGNDSLQNRQNGYWPSERLLTMHRTHTVHCPVCTGQTLFSVRCTTRQSAFTAFLQRLFEWLGA
jgi:hypothetical protein